MLEQVTVGPGPSHYGEAIQEAVEATAQRILAQALKQRRWTEKDLTSRSKGDPGKVALASELRSRTMVPLSWIAQRLKMGSRGYLTWLLQRQIKPDDKQRALIACEI